MDCEFSGAGLGFHWGEARAQTACPGGVTAGSRMCGPDGLLHYIHVVRHESYGAYAHSMSEDATYVVTGSDAEGLASIRVDVIADCQRDGNADCYILGEWRNSCASVGNVMVDGHKRMIFASGSSGRASKRAVRQQCAASAFGAECRLRSEVACVDFRMDRVPC